MTDGLALQAQDIPIVAIGASAGGLEPLEAFFAALTADPGAAFVVVQHLSPDYRSMMDELLGRRSNLPIHRIEDGTKIEPNNIYLNRPNMYVRLEGDVFRTEAYQPDQGLPHLPIDRFFISLTTRDAKRTIAVVLSGSGSDGSHGAQLLYEAGAAVLVQSMQEAAFASMPRAVLLSGAVDRVMDAKDMPATVQDILTYGKKNAADPPEAQTQGIDRILRILEDRYAVDFASYKPSSINRRIVRRLHLRGFASTEEYAEVLSQNDEALSELFHDMLIGVTEFYRDPEAVTSLRRQVLDQLAREEGATAPIKVWVAGCASGEEVYTIAIELAEALREAGSDRRFRIIGTDIHATSVETASRGVYDAEKVERVPKALRERYFVPTGGKFAIDPILRQQVIFSNHNLISDPPFMNLDLISCRNLMIYLRTEPQASALSMFIFGLKRDGYLFLGASETIGRFKSTFEVIDARWRVFRKIGDASEATRSALTSRRTSVVPPEPAGPGDARPFARKPLLGEVVEVRSRETLIRSYDTLLKRYAPASILLTAEGRVLNWFGAAEAFIDTMNNLAEWTVQEIVHQDLHFAINVGVEKLRQGHFTTHKRRVTVHLPDREPQDCIVEIEPLAHSQSSNLILAKIDLIEPGPDGDGATEETDNTVHERRPADEDATVLTERIHALERDLRLTEETLQHVTERLEASGEELQASNEELQASNEELQASNEELQSSNEELHAVNEELVSVSAEHERKIELLSELNENTEAVLKMLNTGVLVLDEARRIRRFSGLVERDFLLQDHDIDRSIATVGPRVDFADLEDMVASLREAGGPQRRSGMHQDRKLDIEARQVRLGKAGEGQIGTVMLFRWS